MVSNSRSLTAARDRFKMFSFSIMQSTFSFSNKEILAVPKLAKLALKGLCRGRKARHLIVMKSFIDQKFNVIVVIDGPPRFDTVTNN